MMLPAQPNNVKRFRIIRMMTIGRKFTTNNTRLLNNTTNFNGIVEFSLTFFSVWFSLLIWWLGEFIFLALFSENIVPILPVIFSMNKFSFNFLVANFGIFFLVFFKMFNLLFGMIVFIGMVGFKCLLTEVCRVLVIQFDSSCIATIPTSGTVFLESNKGFQ